MKFILAIFILSTLTVLVGVGNSGQGVYLQALEQKIKALDEENKDLSEIIISQSSLKLVSDNASNLQLSEGKNRVYWNDNLTVAKLR